MASKFTESHVELDNHQFIESHVELDNHQFIESHVELDNHQFIESHVELDDHQLDLDQHLEVKLVAAKGTSYEHTWDKTISSLTELNLPKLTGDQADLLKAIIKEKWSYSVSFHELDQAIYGLFPNQSDNQLKKIFESEDLSKHLKCEFQSMQSLIIKSFPVISTEDQDRTLLLVRNEIEDIEEWVGINTCTIRRVPYLEAFCSNRWGKDGNGVKVIKDVKAETIRLLDLYYSHLPEKELDLYESLSITSLPLPTFKISLSQMVQDLDFLNVKFQALPHDISDDKTLVEEIQAKSVGPFKDHYFEESHSLTYPDLEVAGWIAFAFHEGLDPKCISKLNQNFLIYKIAQILGLSQFYGKNLSNNLVLAFQKYIELGYDPKSSIKARDNLYGRLAGILGLGSSPSRWHKISGATNIGPFLDFISNTSFFTKNQKKELERRAQQLNNNTETKEDHVIDGLYTRERFKETLESYFKKEKEITEERLGPFLGRFGGGMFGNRCPQLYMENAECTCGTSERANMHGYIDEHNWDSDWGAFSAGSD